MDPRSEKFDKPKIVTGFLPVDAPIKETLVVDFEQQLLPYVKKGKEDDIKDLCAALTSARNMVIWALDRDRTTLSTDELFQKVNDYIRLLRGFLTPPRDVHKDSSTLQNQEMADDEKEEDKTDQQEKQENVKKTVKTLRFVVSYIWRDLLDVKGRDWEMGDCALEEASILLAVAQKLLSKIAREALSDSNSVDIHSTLRKVAGILAEARKLVSEAEVQSDAGAVAENEDTSSNTKKDCSDIQKKHIDSAHRASTDLRLALPEAWAQLALAEAQTATLNKACNATHIEWSLVAALCSDQVQRYGNNVKGHVEALVKAAPDAANVKEWAGKRVSHNFLKAHVEFKRLYFTALARYCSGVTLLERAISETDENLNSKALAELGTALAIHKDAQSQAANFVTTAKPITFIHDPAQPLQDSLDLLKRAYNRANQLDTSIFHRGPCPELQPFPQPKSLITATPFPDPGISNLWTPEVWNAFDPQKVPEDGVFRIASASRDCCAIS